MNYFLVLFIFCQASAIPKAPRSKSEDDKAGDLIAILIDDEDEEAKMGIGKDVRSILYKAGLLGRAQPILEDPTKIQREIVRPPSSYPKKGVAHASLFWPSGMPMQKRPSSIQFSPQSTGISNMPLARLPWTDSRMRQRHTFSANQSPERPSSTFGVIKLPNSQQNLAIEIIPWDADHQRNSQQTVNQPRQSLHSSNQPQQSTPNQRIGPPTPSGQQHQANSNKPIAPPSSSSQQAQQILNQPRTSPSSSDIEQQSQSGWNSQDLGSISMTHIPWSRGAPSQPPKAPAQPPKRVNINNNININPSEMLITPLGAPSGGRSLPVQNLAWPAPPRHNQQESRSRWHPLASQNQAGNPNNPARLSMNEIPLPSVSFSAPDNNNAGNKTVAVSEPVCANGDCAGKEQQQPVADDDRSATPSISFSAKLEDPVQSQQVPTSDSTQHNPEASKPGPGGNQDLVLWLDGNGDIVNLTKNNVMAIPLPNYNDLVAGPVHREKQSRSAVPEDATLNNRVTNEKRDPMYLNINDLTEIQRAVLLEGLLLRDSQAQHGNIHQRHKNVQQNARSFRDIQSSQTHHVGNKRKSFRKH